MGECFCLLFVEQYCYIFVVISVYFSEKLNALAAANWK